MARRDSRAKVRARHHREAAVKRKIQTVLDPLAPAAQQRVLDRVMGVDIPAVMTRSEEQTRDLLAAAVDNGVDQSFETLDEMDARVTGPVARIIGRMVTGDPVTAAEREQARAEWSEIVTAHRDGVAAALDRMEVVRESIARRGAHLSVEVLRADLTLSFLPPSPDAGRIRVADPRLKDLAFREPNLLDAARSTARWIGREEARKVFDKALETIGEGEAFDTAYMTWLRDTLAAHDPRAAEALAKTKGES